MKTELTRRGVIAALTAGAAVNVPAIAMTVAVLPSASAATGAQPDHALLDLGRRYDAALAAEDAASEARTATCEAFDAARPAMPDVLRHRMADHFEHQFPALAGTKTICDTDASDFYNDAEVEYLRTMPHRTEDGRERAGLVMAEWDRHREACLALASSLGCGDAETAYYAAVDAREAIGDAIVAARATTLHGLAVRARIVTSIAGDDLGGDILPTDQKMLLAIVRDLTRMAS